MSSDTHARGLLLGIAMLVASSCAVHTQRSALDAIKCFAPAVCLPTLSTLAADMTLAFGFKNLNNGRLRFTWLASRSLWLAAIHASLNTEPRLTKNAPCTSTIWLAWCWTRLNGTD